MEYPFVTSLLDRRVEVGGVLGVIRAVVFVPTGFMLLVEMEQTLQVIGATEVRTLPHFARIE